MSYSFEVSNYEEEMKNYFRGVSGRHIKDTLFITLRNNGSKGWSRYKGSFRCNEKQSNIFFEETQINQEVYPNSGMELVLNFPRIEKNRNSGNCFCSIELVYNNEVYNSQVIRFRKDYDLLGNQLIVEEKIEIEKEEEKQQQVPKEEKKEKEVFQPHKIEEEIKVKKQEPKKEKKENENDIIVKKFRSAFDFSKADFSDEYILELILKSNKDFQKAMELHLEKEDAKKYERKSKSKTKEGLEELLAEFRKAYQLSEQDYSNEKIKEVLAKKEGHFENTFEELMSFIQ